MGLKEKIYERMPITLQNVLTSIYGRKLINERYGVFYESKLTEIRERDKNFDVQQYQLKQLNELLLYAWKHSDYYHEILKDIKLPLTTLEELNNIPLINKEVIRRRIDNIVTENKNSLIKSNTGGTTGKSLTVYYTKKNMQERMAHLDYFKEGYGVKKGMRRASFSGKNLVPIKQKKKVYWRYNKPLNQLLFSSFHATDANLKYYIDKLNQFKPISIDGFPSVILKLAKFILKNDINLTFKPKAIFPTAEALIETDRNIIETAFKCQVRNQYASSEGAPFITECPKGSLHLNIDTGVFEKVEKENDTSEILITSFTTYGTPLIRYKIGDSLVFTDQECDCEFKTPIVKEILGRSKDFLYSEERGTVSSVNMANAIKQLPNSIKAVQFVQKTVDCITVNLVPDTELFKDSHLRILENELRQRLGKHIEIKFNMLDELTVEKSGKIRFIKNTVDFT